MRIKDWFLNKNFTSNERFVINCADELVVTRKTEKAVFIEAVSDYGKLKFWVPKSCIMTDEEVEKEINERNKKMEAGLDRLQKLVAWAKEKGVKGVRMGMRRITVEKKIREAGLGVPEM